MADTEKNEDQKISRCLQEAFGYTDEQLLKQLDQANETLKDVTFDGAEDRIMKKIMARKAELEKQTSAPEPETERNITLVKADTEDRKGKKIVRFGKKKVLATVALVAVIAGMLGGTAVGKKNYFFRSNTNEVTTIFIDNDKNKSGATTLDNAYSLINEKLNIPVLKLGYLPTDLLFTECKIYKDQAQLFFEYKGAIILFSQVTKDETASLKYEFDAQQKETVFNKWLNRDIEYTVNTNKEGKKEYESIITIKGNVYFVVGCMPEVELKKILENLTFL